jgi:hypothetical protein
MELDQVSVNEAAVAIAHGPPRQDALEIRGGSSPIEDEPLPTGPPTRCMT